LAIRRRAEFKAARCGWAEVTGVVSEADLLWRAILFIK
jgi:hypothetical protein